MGWGRDTRPVINVSWEDAQAYVAWLSGKLRATCRLPSEAEWEYAARAGTTTEYALPAPDGSNDISGKGLANCVDCGTEWEKWQFTAPVTGDGRFEPNAWGLYDMHGNVWELVEDWWHENYEGAPDDGRVWQGELDDPIVHLQLKTGGILRVLRGGSWADDQDAARSAARMPAEPYYRDKNVGFRVVCVSPIFGH